LLRRTIAFAAISAICFALAPAARAIPDLTWDATTGRELADVAVDADGNVYVTGFRREGGRTVMIVRSFAPDGTVRWRRSWVPPDVDGEPASTVGWEIDVAGGVVAVGGRVSKRFCNAEGWWLRTYTTDGELLWTRQERGWRRCAASSWTEAISTDGSSIVFGWNELKGEPYTRGQLRAYDLAGTALWTVEFDAPRFGNVMDGVRDATILAGGDIAVVGWTRDRPDRDPDGRYHLVVQMLASDGNVNWTRRPGAATHRLASADSVDIAGTSLVVGATVDRRSGRVAWLASICDDGALTWTREWPTTGWETSASVASDGSSFVIHRIGSGGDGGADARIRNVASTGEVLSRGRLDRGALDIDTTSIDSLGTGFVVAAGIQGPVGGYVARFG
jgi:hypothetical protein